MTAIRACTADLVGGECPAGFEAWVSPLDLVSFADMGITSEAVFFAFGWGFGALVLLWFFGYVIHVGLLAIRKV